MNKHTYDPKIPEPMFDIFLKGVVVFLMLGCVFLYQKGTTEEQYTDDICQHLDIKKAKMQSNKIDDTMFNNLNCKD